MHLKTETRVEAAPRAVFERLNDPATFMQMNDDMHLTPAGPDTWTLKAKMNGADVEADLVRAESAEPERITYNATAQGLLVTLGFDLTPVEAQTDLAVGLTFAGTSMKGKMLMQGLKFMEARMQTGLERMVHKLARAA